VIRKIELRDAALYLVAQFAGAGAAYFLSGVILGSHPAVTAVDSAATFGGEALGTFWLATGVCAWCSARRPRPPRGSPIGGSLLLGISLAAPLSNGVLNPAVALGIGSLSAVYIAAPIVGAAVAMLLYRFLAGRRSPFSRPGLIRYVSSERGRVVWTKSLALLADWLGVRVFSKPPEAKPSLRVRRTDQ